MEENKIDEKVVTEYLGLIFDELKNAIKEHNKFNSAHEGYAVLLEEVDEMWDAIKQNNITHARIEAVQVGAMALRFLCDSHHLRKEE